MNLKTLLLAASTSALLATAALAGDLSDASNLRAVPGADRIVGLWSGEGLVRPCGTSLPLSAVRNTLLFNTGGTVVENSRFPPQGAPNVYGITGMNQRSGGLGTWSFDARSGAYALHLRFDWYVDGVYHGYQTVDREFQMSADGERLVGSVVSTRYSTSGAVLAAVCGEGTSDRL
jgi:hypothetical protein